MVRYGNWNMNVQLIAAQIRMVENMKVMCSLIHVWYIISSIFTLTFFCRNCVRLYFLHIAKNKYHTFASFNHCISRQNIFQLWLGHVFAIGIHIISALCRRLLFVRCCIRVMCGADQGLIGTYQEFFDTQAMAWRYRTLRTTNICAGMQLQITISFLSWQDWQYWRPWFLFIFYLFGN